MESLEEISVADVLLSATPPCSVYWPASWDGASGKFEIPGLGIPNLPTKPLDALSVSTLATSRVVLVDALVLALNCCLHVDPLLDFIFLALLLSLTLLVLGVLQFFTWAQQRKSQTEVGHTLSREHRSSRKSTCS